MAHEWNIRPRSPLCAACQTPFKKGQTCVSAIAPQTDETGATTLVRSDWCLDCWSSSPLPNSVSVWQSIVQPHEPSTRTDTTPKQAVESLFRQLLDEDDPARAPVIFILALMLERRKLLLERGTRSQPDGTLIRLYEHRLSGEAFFVLDPGLNLRQLEPVQQAVAELLAQHLPPA